MANDRHERRPVFAAGAAKRPLELLIQLGRPDPQRNCKELRANGYSKRYLAVLAFSGTAYVVAQAGLFLWSGEWLSPVDAIALPWTAVRELGWVAEPQRWLGVHVIVSSAWFGPIAIGASRLPA